MSGYKYNHNIDLRLGRWQDTLADVGEVDALISDPPYSEKTHDGHFAGCSAGPIDDTRKQWLARKGYDDKPSRRREIDYAAWNADDVEGFVKSWSPRCRGWFVVISDHILARDFEKSLSSEGLYVFQPIPFTEVGKCPRLNGDGPASWTCWITVARPKEKRFASWGSLPGSYVYQKGQVEQKKAIVGGKPMALMRALVRDYSKPGDLIVDPCAGAATTLIAAASENRRAIGAECDPATYEVARKRIAAGYTPSLFEGVG